LTNEYATTIDTLATQSTMSVDDKLKHLEAKEVRIQEQTTKQHAHTAFRSSNKYRPPQRRYNNPSSEDSTDDGGARIPRNSTCYLCDSTEHFGAKCTWLESAKEFVRDKKKAVRFKESQSRSQPRSRSHSRSRATSSTRDRLIPTTRPNLKTTLKKSSSPRVKTYVADADDSGSVNSADESDVSSDEEREETDEVCQLSKELIRKATPSIWPADTGATSHMSDQPNLFRQLIPIECRSIAVRGGCDSPSVYTRNW
jgi:hypothetical protein